MEVRGRQHGRRARSAGGRSLAVLIGGLLIGSAVVRSEPVGVRYPEGSVHGFLVLRALDGTRLANGDLIQVARGAQVTTQVVFHFTDGSLHDETAVFSQRGQFRLIRDHLVQKGPAFPRSIDMSVDGASGRVTVRSGDHGEEKTFDERLELPADLANGLIPILLKNVRADAPPKTLSLVVATPKPRIVRLVLGPASRERFRTGTESRQARLFVIKVEIGGVSGLLAPLVGKEPPPSHVWILEGQAPAFVRAEQPFYIGGPLWRIDLVSPSWQVRDGRGPRAHPPIPISRAALSWYTLRRIPSGRPRP